VVGREELGPGDRLAGPCLITEPQTTTVVPADFELELAADGALLLNAVPKTGSETP
jgi:N-methylhydantoinase A